jgi:hypothetical protein
MKISPVMAGASYNNVAFEKKSKKNEVVYQSGATPPVERQQVNMRAVMALLAMLAASPAIPAIAQTTGGTKAKPQTEQTSKKQKPTVWIEGQSEKIPEPQIGKWVEFQDPTLYIKIGLVPSKNDPSKFVEIRAELGEYKGEILLKGKVVKINCDQDDNYFVIKGISTETNKEATFNFREYGSTKSPNVWEYVKKAIDSDDFTDEGYKAITKVIFYNGKPITFNGCKQM